MTSGGKRWRRYREERAVGIPRSYPPPHSKSIKLTVPCKNLNTSHDALISFYRKARAVPGVRKVMVASGVRYDLAVESPQYVRELVEHHVGGYLKIAPEHTEAGPLARMMKPGIGAYDRFKA